MRNHVSILTIQGDDLIEENIFSERGHHNGAELGNKHVVLGSERPAVAQQARAGRQESSLRCVPRAIRMTDGLEQRVADGEGHSHSIEQTPNAFGTMGSDDYDIDAKVRSERVRAQAMPSTGSHSTFLGVDVGDRETRRDTLRAWAMRF